MFENLPIIDLLNTGVSGFAVVMMYFSYRLLRTAQTAVTNVKPQDFESVEFYESWCRGIAAPLAYIRYFMVLTGLIFFGGLALLFWDPENTIIVSVVPSESHLLPEVQHQGTTFSFTDGTSVPLRVKADQDLFIKASKLVGENHDLRLTIDNLKDQLQAFTASTTAEIDSDETGL